MADQAINALSTKTAPETSDQLLLVGAGEPQMIDYDKLADAILNKITSKKYALDAGIMTLPAALNALNGNKAQKATYALNDNINDILVSGNYCEIIPAWGNIGGLYPSWAWGIVLTSKNIANFIGVATVSKKLAVAQYSNGAWTKIM